MLLISQSTAKSIEGGSWIRKMFEAGIALKAEYGEDKVCDFSLGNPDLAPPHEVALALRELATNVEKPFALGYMPNGGSLAARKALATRVSKEQGVSISHDDVMLSCGAAGAMNAFFKATLDHSEEVIAIAPYFVEYGAYVSNHAGKFKTVQSKPGTFELDLDAIEKAISDKTRAIIINSPNNPTGQVYSKEQIQGLVDILRKKNQGQERPLFLIADEPYRFLAYDGIEVPSILSMYEYGVVISSFSKNLCIPGERIGYIIVSPHMPEKGSLMSGLILANRILGYVNPPVVGQYIVEKTINAQVDPGIYLSRRNLMASILKDAGYEFFMPKGAFYFFPKAPGGNDAAFVDKLMKERVLAVPGTGFGGPGYFRLAFCVDENVIERAAEGFKKAIKG